MAIDDSSAPGGPIRVGVAGVGRAGWNLHIATLTEQAALFQVIGVADPLPGRAQAAAAERGFRAFATFTELVEAPELELIVVCAPTHLHAPLAVEALRAGKHVLVEKPLATSVVELDAMAAAAAAAGRLLLGSQNRRYAADFATVRDVVASGLLGRVHEIKLSAQVFRRRWDWQALAEQGGGALLNDGSHLIDLGLLLFGPGRPDVWCQLRRTPLALGTADDHVKVLLSGDNAPLIDIEISYACALPQPQWMVLGSAGGLAGDGERLRWRHVDPHNLVARTVATEASAERHYDQEQLTWTERERTVAEPYVAGHRRMYRHVYAAIRHGADVGLAASDLRQQVEVLDYCRAMAMVGP